MTVENNQQPHTLREAFLAGVHQDPSRTMAAAGLAVSTVYGAQPYWPEKKLRICITGAGGFIASHLAKRLKEEGHYIIGCDWKRNEHMSV